MEASIAEKLSTLLILIMGWPAIITSLGFSFVGVARKQYKLILIGTLLAVPFAWYLNATPRFRGIGALLPVLQLGAALTVYRGHAWLALLLLLPFVSITFWLAFVVLTQ